MVGNFLEYIQFHKIPANVLMREIHPLGLVPYSIIMNALAYQVCKIIYISKNIINNKTFNRYGCKKIEDIIKAIFFQVDLLYIHEISVFINTYLFDYYTITIQ